MKPYCVTIQWKLADSDFMAFFPYFSTGDENSKRHDTNDASDAVQWFVTWNSVTCLLDSV